MITILCAGSRGDFQPYIALAQQIMKLGYQVRITGSKDYQNFIEDYGIECFPLQVGLEDVDVDPKLLAAAGSSDNPLKMLRTFNKMKDYGVFMIEDMYKACLGSELIIYHPGCTIGYFVAEKLGIPAIMASPFPLHKTNEYLSVIMYGKFKTNKLNLMISYKLIQSMLWMTSKSALKTFWKKIGALPHDFSCPYQRVSPTYPSVISCSNYVFPRPHDWNENIHQEGYWFVEEDNFEAPKDLVDFLNEGDKPIYIGFGSMMLFGNHQNLLETIMDCLEKVGKRAVLSGFQPTSNLPKSVFMINNVPHSWLFPRMAAVCHHGGAGTTAAGFKAGVPSIIIPFSNDQFAWAYRAYDLKVGSYPINKNKITAAVLADCIEYALRDDIVANAKKLKESLDQEKGAQDIAKVVVESLNKHEKR